MCRLFMQVCDNKTINVKRYNNATKIITTFILEMVQNNPITEEFMKHFPFCAFKLDLEGNLTLICVTKGD